MIEETLKKTELPDGDYLKIDFGYSLCLLVPYDDGIQMMSHMKQAFVYETPHKEPFYIHKINGTPKITITSSEQINPEMALSEKRFKEKQMKTLLEQDKT